MDAVATVDVLTTDKNDVNLVETLNVLFARLLNHRLVLIAETNSTAFSCIGSFYHLFTP